MPLEVSSSSEDETLKLAECIGRFLPRGFLILLNGELGAGKTVFAKGLGRGLGVKEEITSPSFNLMLRYEGRMRFDHWDLYRIENIDDDPEFLESVYDAESACAVEWGDKLKSTPDVPTLTVEIEIADDEHARLIRLNANPDIITGIVEPAINEWEEK
jgi:tRNA threonylcarbamoyladenosine biosynthesis protein TsaE